MNDIGGRSHIHLHEAAGIWPNVDQKNMVIDSNRVALSITSFLISTQYNYYWSFVTT